MDIYFRTEKSIIRMNDILEARGKYLVNASLDRKEQCVLGEFESEEIAKKILEKIDYIIDAKIKENTPALIVAIPKKERNGYGKQGK